MIQITALNSPVSPLVATNYHGDVLLNTTRAQVCNYTVTMDYPDRQRLT